MFFRLFFRNELFKMARNQINIENNTIQNFYNCINSKEEKPLENMTLNLLSGSSCFKGRETTLNEIKELFETNQVVVIYGAPGIGKTETARHFAENNSEYFNGNLIWVYAETAQNIQNCFGELAASLELKTSDVSQVYSSFRKSRCLFIFDNVENMAAISNFLPNSKVHPTMRILITSQFSEWDFSVSKVHIKALKPEDAVNILSEKLGDTFYKNPQINWYKIVERLECIPLSIQIVSSLLYQKFRTIPIKNFDFEGFINELMDGSFINSKFLISEQNHYNKTVILSIYSAVNRLEMEEALDSLCFIAYLDADYIYYRRLLSIPSINKSNDKLQEALNKLKDYSLIQFEFKERNYKIKVHRTIQLVLRKYDLNEQHGKMFKALLLKIIILKNFPYCHMSLMSEYIEKEEFQEQLITFYDKNANKVELYLSFLAKLHCDKILRLLLPKFKNQFYKSDKYNKILNKMMLEVILNVNITEMNTINLLINYGAKITYSPESNCTNGFHEAFHWLSKELFDRLLESNDSKIIINSKDQWGRTILHLLIEWCYKSNISKTIECIDHLITKWNADILIRDNQLNNVLHKACRNENIYLEVIKYLVEKCNCKHLVNSQNEEGQTPLHFIFKYNYHNSALFGIVSYLIKECDADLTIQNNDGWNTFFYVCRYRRSKFIDFILTLINCREIINIQNKWGNVAFSYLIYNKRIEEDEKIELIKLFVVNEMDFKIRNKRNRTLAEMAEKIGLIKLSTELKRQENDVPNNKRNIEISNETPSKKLCVPQSRGLWGWLVNKFK